VSQQGGNLGTDPVRSPETDTDGNRTQLDTDPIGDPAQSPEEGTRERSTDPDPEENRTSSIEHDYGGESDKEEPDLSGPIRKGVEPTRLEAEVRSLERMVGAGECEKAE
jgi:hypothetical protein